MYTAGIAFFDISLRNHRVREYPGIQKAEAFLFFLRVPQKVKSLNLWEFMGQQIK